MVLIILAALLHVFLTEADFVNESCDGGEYNEQETSVKAPAV